MPRMWSYIMMRKQKANVIVILALTVASMTFGTFTALAQTPTLPSAQAPAPLPTTPAGTVPGRLPQVTVNAENEPQDPQQAPVAVTAVTSTVLSQTNAA